MKEKPETAVAEQKVFVRLRDVLNLQESYLHAVATRDQAQANYVALKTAVNQTALGMARARLQAFEQIIRNLHLPIDIK